MRCGLVVNRCSQWRAATVLSTRWHDINRNTTIISSADRAAVDSGNGYM